MKKLFVIMILFSFSANIVLSQSLILPHHVVGRNIDSSGEITNQYPADFQYNSEGKLSYFEFPQRNLTSQLTYDSLYLSNITTNYYSDGGEGYNFTWTKVYEFENGLIQMEFYEEFEATYENYDRDYILYYYNNDNQLIRKEQGYAPDHICHIWTYEYDDQGKLHSESYYISWGCPGPTCLSSFSTYQYDAGLLQEILIEEYDDYGNNIIENKKQIYTYTEEGKPASEITQTFVENEWVNNTIHSYIYDPNGMISEQQEGIWSDSLNNWDITKKIIHELSLTEMTYTISFYKKSGEEWVWDKFNKKQTLFFEPELKWQQLEMENFYTVNQIEFSITLSSILEGSEWYYEILNDDGFISYQHLECTADTTINNERPKVIVRSNTQYDRDTLITEVTHEYVYEENGKVYWWNRDLEDFTVLYDFAAQPGDEWEIKVGTESLIMHVDTVENYVYEGKTYRMLHVSDANDFFSGDIVCGVGHLTSFFPERLMNRGQNRYVNGLRCYWIDDELILKIGNKDCDAVYNELHDLNQTEPYYGFIYQPDTAIIYLSPNNPYEVNNNQLYAGFRYSPNGLLERSYVETYDMYGHWMHYYYDSDLHVILEGDIYFDLGAAPFQNQYSYEDGLLMNYSRYYDNYHEQTLTLLDSISYSYDELRRLQTEKRFQSTTYEKTYEYNENEVIITTDGYSNGTNGDWIRLDKETRGFSEDSLLLTQQNEPYNDSATLVTYGYDEQGHRVSALTQNRYNGAWKNQKLVQYHFNPYGHLILAEIKLWQEDEFVNANRAIYELNEMGYPSVVTFEKWDGEAWVDGVWQPEFYLYNEDHLKQQNDMLYDYRDFVNKIEMTYVVTENPREPLLPDYCEWFYEIENENGSTTYQHLEYAGDTTINNERPKVIVRSNTQYDRDTIITEVTHEYIYDDNGIVYWWNKDLEEFTTLYDLSAEVGDEWEIKVGTESLIMHVDAVENYEYEGKTYRMLRVSDENDLFSGNIVSGVGHLTSFFPERLMNRDKGYRVTGLRCYWVEGNLILKINRDDCDAIYAQLHNGIEEDGPSTGSGTLVVYPNPTDGYLVLETQSIASLQTQTYRITNLMGQTLLQGTLIAETQQIDITRLPAGMYFITLGGQTVKFVVK